jgi:sirohydrochlorin ferrochelatase
VLLAHGSPDARHARGVEALAQRVRALAPARPVHTAYLDHHQPDPASAAAAAGTGAVVPVLLTPAYHVRVDVPAAVAAMNEAAGGGFRATDALGPDPLLLEGVLEVLAAAGVVADPGTAVVLYAAGSSDSAAVATITQTLAAHPPAGAWGPWSVAALDGGQALPAVLAGLPAGVRRVVAVSFMVAEGILRDRMAAFCDEAGIPLVPGTLGDTDAVARLVLERADAAQRRADGLTTARPIACRGERADQTTPTPARRP